MNKEKVEAIARMEAFAREMLKLSPEGRDRAFDEFVKTGLMTNEEAQIISNYVCYYRLFTDARYYRAIKQAVGEMLYYTFNQTGENNER